MTAIPSGTKFVGIGASVPTPENKSSQNNAFQEVYTIDDIIAEAQDGMQASVVTVANISSAELLAVPAAKANVLPALDVNEYYTGRVTAEFTYGTSLYTIGNGTGTSISIYVLVDSERVIAIINADELLNGSTGVLTVQLNANFVSLTGGVVSVIVLDNDLVDPELAGGDGTVRLVFETEKRTFGA